MTAQPPIVYTAMHGVGKRFVKAIFEHFGFPAVIEVERQVEPDPTFPTVKFPNPEEGKGALQLSMEKANAVGANLVFASVCCRRCIVM